MLLDTHRLGIQLSLMQSLSVNAHVAWKRLCYFQCLPYKELNTQSDGQN